MCGGFGFVLGGLRARVRLASEFEKVEIVSMVIAQH